MSDNNNSHVTPVCQNGHNGNTRVEDAGDGIKEAKICFDPHGYVVDVPYKMTFSLTILKNDPTLTSMRFFSSKINQILAHTQLSFDLDFPLAEQGEMSVEALDTIERLTLMQICAILLGGAPFNDYLSPTAKHDNRVLGKQATVWLVFSMTENEIKQVCIQTLLEECEIGKPFTVKEKLLDTVVDIAFLSKQKATTS